MQERTCPVCSTTFEPRVHNQRYCTGYRGKCYRRAMNHAYRSKRGQETIDLDAPMQEPFGCAYCRKHCRPGANVAAHASRFCGAHCKAAWHHHHIEGQPRAPAEQLVVTCRDRSAIARWRSHCAELVLSEAGFSVKSYDVTAYRKALRRDPCSYCGGNAEALDHIEPRQGNGSDGWENRTATCHMCNSYKSGHTLLLALLFVPAARQYHALRRVLH